MERGSRMEGVDSANEQMERANRFYRDKFEAGEREKYVRL